MSSPDRLLITFCGLPGAGKSFLLRLLLQEGYFHRYIVQYIVFDDLLQRNEPGAEFDAESWRQAQVDMATMVKTTLRSHQKTDNDTQQLILFVDDNFHLRSMRKQYHSIAADCDSAFGIIYADTDEETCRERNRQRASTYRVPESVLNRMVARFEAPDPKRFSFERAVAFTSAMIENRNAWFDDLLSAATCCWCDERRAKEERVRRAAQHDDDRKLTSANFIHRLDQGLRKSIGDAMRKSDASDKKQIAVQFNDLRKQFLADRRGQSGILSLEQVDPLVQEFRQRLDQVQK